MTREQTYTEQLQTLGIWDPAFAPEVHTLACMERDLQRAQKSARELAKLEADGKPLPKNPPDYFSMIASLRRDILAHRDALGLTPKALTRLRGKAADAPAEADGISARLDALAAKVSAYE